MRWVENVACVGEKINGDIVSLRKLKFRCKWNSCIKVGFKELTCEDVGLILWIKASYEYGNATLDGVKGGEFVG
jgi:hypothetical protein